MPHQLVSEGNDGADLRLDAAVASEQLHLLTKKGFVLVINVVNAAISCAAFRKLFPWWVATAWMALFCLVILFRALSQRRYREVRSDREPTERWGQIFTLSAFVTGCLWGLAGTAILVTPDPYYQVFIVFLVGGMMAGGIVSNAAYLPSMLSFMLPTILPTIVILLTRTGIIHIEMGIMLTVFAIVLIAVGRNINQSIIENFRLRLLQDQLVAKLSASETAMAESQALAHVGSFRFDVRTKVFTGSVEAHRIFAFDPNAPFVSYERVFAHVHPDDRTMVQEKVNSAVATGLGHEIYHRIVREGGEIRYVHEITKAICDAQGNSELLFGTIEDITEQRQGEAAKAQLAAIVDSSIDAIASETLDGTITSWNRGAERLYGYLADEIIGKDVRILIPEDRHKEVDDNLFALSLGRSIEPFDTERTRKDGTQIAVSIAVSSIFDLDGRSAGGSFIARDITERRQAAKELAYQESLLHAVTIGTGILIKAESVELRMPEALRILGESMDVDRVLVMQEFGNQKSSPILRYVWQAKGIKDTFDFSTFSPSVEDSETLAAWRSTLYDGRPIVGQRATSIGSVRSMLDHFNSLSTLIVPVFVDTKLWGTLAVDSCSVAREWTTSEIETMKTFGDMAGALIVHNETIMSLEASEERFRVLTATAQDAIITTDKAGMINHWNLAAERILGYTAEEAIGQQVHQFLAPASRRGEPDPGLAKEGGEAGRTIELTVVRKDGTEIAAELSVSGTSLGGNWLSIGILRDITKRKTAEAKLEFANLLLKAEMEASPDGILVVDADRKIISFNRLFADIWKSPRSELAVGNDFNVLAAGLELVKEPKTFSTLVQRLYDHPNESSHDEFEMKDGRTIERYTVTLTTESADNLGRVWFFRDVTERKLAAAHALRMARFDVLTGLANRSVFVEALDLQIARAKRGNKSFAVIYLDLDHFKDVNDTLGHPIGDALLLAVAERLESNTRASDTVARFGGDEFAVVVADVRDPADVAILAEKLIHVLDDPYSILGNDIYSSASIGIDLYGPDACDAETLLSHADVALYRAKSEGRSGYRFFTEAMDADVRMQVSLGTELHEALNSGQLFLLYQPQVAVVSERITGLEALVRWRHPSRGILGPDIFIPVAEKMGMIVKLGHWVMLTACEQAKIWFEGGITSVRMAVNLSALQFKSPVALESDISAILRETGLPPHMLELELTEGVLMNASRDHNNIIPNLRRIGVTIAIDDFGTGYSSLDYLRRFPADRIKIAQTFVRHLETMPGDMAIVKATLGLAHEMGIVVIAEGVETPEQYNLLKGWGCAEVQGFYFAEPMTAEDATLLLRSGVALKPRSSKVH